MSPGDKDHTHLRTTGLDNMLVTKNFVLLKFFLSDRKVGNMIEARCSPAGFEDGRKGQEPKNARNAAPGLAVASLLAALEGAQP